MTHSLNKVTYGLSSDLFQKILTLTQFWFPAHCRSSISSLRCKLYLKISYV